MTATSAGCGATGPGTFWSLVLALLLGLSVLAAVPAMAQTVDPNLNTEAAGSESDARIWAEIRKGTVGKVTIPDGKAAQLIQSEGEDWRSIRNGPLSVYSAYLLFGMIALLALFFALRGRVRIEHGRAGVTIERFNAVECFGHWLMAVSFIVLALSGLNMLFGRTVLMPLIGKPAFSTITMWGKYLHNYLAFAFMAGVALVFVMWVVHNLPNRHDLVWLVRGGGLFSRGSHPPARKFNAGQKIMFWLVVLCTISVSLSGIALLFPFQTAFMAKTFAFLNLFGLDLPTDLSPLREQQLNQLWHAAVGVVFIAVILGHIYIGTLGMEGAFDAMGSGQVDLNWAREHHNLWVEELEAKGRLRPAPAGGEALSPHPAE